ncbi:MAG: histone deacetylase [Anaerolineae bacterium]|nr:histone deacetylase [Anaerolineae bacterium]
MSTGYVYHPIFLEHNLPSHPENARRLEQTMAALWDSGILERLVQVEPRPASVEELARVHSLAHIDCVRQVSARGGGYLDGDTYLSARSYAAACMAAGGMIAAVDALLGGEIDNGFALLRPPGHHATSTRGMGFCLFNNVAIAARHALTHPGIERVFIADFDVHHGNGTQEIFECDPRVFYFSTHEYPFYPGTGHWQETGQGAGKGSVLNVPLPAGVGDAGYARVFEELVWPMARRFRPDVMLISAGYDGHWKDPLAMMLLSLTGYTTITRHLVQMANELCQGRILFALEGGYSLDVLTNAILNTFHVLLGEESVTDPLGLSGSVERPIDDVISFVRNAHAI